MHASMRIKANRNVTTMQAAERRGHALCMLAAKFQQPMAAKFKELIKFRLDTGIMDTITPTKMQRRFALTTSLKLRLHHLARHLHTTIATITTHMPTGE
jgi:hypothetical protein